VKASNDTEEKKFTSRSEVVNLDSPKIQTEEFDSPSASVPEILAENQNTAVLSEETRTYSSVLQQGPPVNPTASDKRDISSVANEDIKRNSLGESGNDEMDISDEDDESPNESYKNAKEDPSEAESLYRGLPDVMIQFERDATSGTLKGSQNLRRSISNPSATAARADIDEVLNANDVSVKERRTLKLAELRAKAKLAQAKLRMARHRKPRIDLSFDPGDGEIKVAENVSEATKSNDGSSSENDMESNHSHVKLSDITALTEVKSLVIYDVSQTGPNEKVRYAESVYETNFDEQHPPIDSTPASRTAETTIEFSDYAAPNQTISDIGPSASTDNRKKSEALKQQLHLAKLRLELKKKQQVLLAKKKTTPHLSTGEAKTDISSSISDSAPLASSVEVNSVFCDNSNASGAELSGSRTKQHLNALEYRRNMLQKLRDRKKELIAKKANLDTNEKNDYQYSLQYHEFPADAGDNQVETEAQLKEGYLPTKTPPSSNKDSRGSAHRIEIKQGNTEDLPFQKKTLKQKNELSTLRSLILRQRDSLREQGQELAENSAQLQACSDEIKSKQKMLDTLDAKLQDMQHRKRILEGMIYRATEKLMASRQALNEYKER